MSRYTFARCGYNIPDNDLIKKFQLMSHCGILVGRATGFPRNTEYDFYKSSHPIPDITQISDMSFADATDHRVQEIIKIAEQSELPIVAYWSGGIDSTVILTAIIKHFPQHLMDRLIIKMSNASYVENSYFFHNVIVKNNLKYTLNTFTYRDAIILHGDPADALWLGGNILTLDSIRPGAHKLNLRSHKDIAIAEFAAKSDDDYAEWLYNFLIETASASNFELVTLSDMFWWIIFNHNYSPMCLKHIGEAADFDEDTLSLYKKNFIFWYDTDEYQAWSIRAQHTGVKFDGSIRSYKMPAKEYIYDLDKNQYYKDFKSKLHSAYASANENIKVNALLEDGTIIFND